MQFIEIILFALNTNNPKKTGTSYPTMSTINSFILLDLSYTASNIHCYSLLKSIHPIEIRVKSSYKSSHLAIVIIHILNNIREMKNGLRNKLYFQLWLKVKPLLLMVPLE